MLTTDQLTLRPLTLADTQDVFEYRSDKITNVYQGWIIDKQEEVQEFIEGLTSEFNKAGTWYQLGIVETESAKLIGDMGLHFIDEKQCELGITLRADRHGKGYATEAMRAVISYLFDTLNKHRITAALDPRNIGSAKLVERLGFRKEAHHIKSYFLNGEWADDVVYAILKEEWQ